MSCTETVKPTNSSLAHDPCHADEEHHTPNVQHASDLRRGRMALGLNADNQAKPFSQTWKYVISTSEWCVQNGMTPTDAANTLKLRLDFFFPSPWYGIWLLCSSDKVEMRLMLLTRGSMACTCQNKKKNGDKTQRLFEHLTSRALAESIPCSPSHKQRIFKAGLHSNGLVRFPYEVSIFYSFAIWFALVSRYQWLNKAKSNAGWGRGEAEYELVRLLKIEQWKKYKRTFARCMWKHSCH